MFTDQRGFSLRDFLLFRSHLHCLETHVSRGGCHLSGLFNDTQGCYFIFGLISSTGEGPKHRQTTAGTTRVNQTPSNALFAWRHTKVIFQGQCHHSSATTDKGDHGIFFGYWDGNMQLGNDTKRMRNCNGPDVGLMSRCPRVCFWREKRGTSLGAHRVVLFLDQDSLLRPHDRAADFLDTVLFCFLFYFPRPARVCGKDGGDTPIPLLSILFISKQRTCKD